MTEEHNGRQLTPEEAAASAAKMLAEARVHEARAAKLQAETAKAQAEADEARAKSDREILEHKKWIEHNRESLGVIMSRDRKFESYPFSYKVCDSSVNDCLDMLNYWHRTKPKCPIEIVFYSPGGEVMPGMRLFDHIHWLSSQGHEMTTVAMGYAASMGGILLQAGDKRKMGREAYVLLHEISFGAGGSIGEVEDEVEFAKKIQARIINIFCDRAKGTGRKGHLTPAVMKRKWKRKDWWVDSDEAWKLGIVDAILGDGGADDEAK